MPKCANDVDSSIGYLSWTEATYFSSLTSGLSNFSTFSSSVLTTGIISASASHSVVIYSSLLSSCGSAEESIWMVDASLTLKKLKSPQISSKSSRNLVLSLRLFFEGTDFLRLYLFVYRLRICSASREYWLLLSIDLHFSCRSSMSVTLNDTLGFTNGDVNAVLALEVEVGRLNFCATDIAAGFASIF